MTSKRLYPVLISLFFAVLMQSACQRVADPCLQSRNVYVRISTLKPADTGSLGVDSLLPNPIVGYATTNQVIYIGTKNVKDFYMQLSPMVDSIKWFITPDSTDVALDTITMYYQRNTVFLSKACGYAHNYVINNVKYTNNRIDSVIINDGNIDGRLDVKNVKVFY